MGIVAIAGGVLSPERVFPARSAWKRKMARTASAKVAGPAESRARRTSSFVIPNHSKDFSANKSVMNRSTSNPPGRSYRPCRALMSTRHCDSSGMSTSGCDVSMARSRVVPERAAPTMNGKGCSVTGQRPAPQLFVQHGGVGEAALAAAVFRRDEDAEPASVARQRTGSICKRRF